MIKSFTTPIWKLNSIFFHLLPYYFLIARPINFHFYKTLKIYFFISKLEISFLITLLHLYPFYQIFLWLCFFFFSTRDNDINRGYNTWGKILLFNTTLFKWSRCLKVRQRQRNTIFIIKVSPNIIIIDKCIHQHLM